MRRGVVQDDTIPLLQRRGQKLFDPGGERVARHSSLQQEGRTQTGRPQSTEKRKRLPVPQGLMVNVALGSLSPPVQSQETGVDGGLIQKNQSLCGNMLSQKDVPPPAPLLNVRPKLLSGVQHFF